MLLRLNMEFSDTDSKLSVMKQFLDRSVVEQALRYIN